VAHRRGYRFLRSRIVLTIGLLFVAAAILLIVSAADAQTDPPATGDWTVGDNTTVENQTVRLRGNLTIVPGGRLTLTNVTLQVFSTITTVNGIRVMGNGSLEIGDHDDDPTTDADRCVVMRGNPSYGYSFLVEKNATLYLVNSLITGMGSRGGTGGVLVKAGGFVIKGSTFMNGDQYDLMLEQSNESRVENCEFYLSRDGLVLKDCFNITIEDSSMMFNDNAGLRIEDSNGTHVKECVISSNGQAGVWATGGGDNELDRTELYENLRGVVLHSAPWFQLNRCTVNDTTFEGISVLRGSHNVTVVNTNVFDCPRSGLEGDGVENLTLWSSSFRSNGYYGVRILNGSVSVTLNVTHVSDNGYDGVHIERARDVLIERGSYRNNGYNGIFLIDINNATVLGSTIVDNTYDGLNCDNVVDTLVDTVDSVDNGYNGINFQAGSHDVKVVGSVLNNNTRSGLGLNSAFNVTFSGLTLTVNDDYGLLVEGGAFNISGSLFLRNNTRGAIRVQESHDVHINGSWIQSDPSSGSLLYGRDAYDIWITNSSTNGTVRLINGANVSMVHCTFETVSPDVDSSSWLKFMTLVDVQVLWPNLTPVTGAVVNATGLGGQVQAVGVTDAEGWTGELVILMETHVGDSVTSENPYTFWARKGTEVTRNETTILGRTRVQIILQDNLPPVAVTGDVRAELGQMATLNGTGSHDNGQLVAWEWTFDDGVGTVVLDGRELHGPVGGLRLGGPHQHHTLHHLRYRLHRPGGGGGAERHHRPGRVGEHRRDGHHGQRQHPHRHGPLHLAGGPAGRRRGGPGLHRPHRHHPLPRHGRLLSGAQRDRPERQLRR
jgi:parallel beta-helix repeat protein